MRGFLRLPLAAIALTALAGCGGSSAASPVAPSGAVKGTLSEWAIGLSVKKVPAGKVTFDVENAGKVKHEFVVLRTAKPAGRLGSGSRIAETGHVGETGDIAPGSSKRVTLHLQPGHYAIVCNLPAHYRLGMHTDFTVG